jgi:hypothetical protein
MPASVAGRGDAGWESTLSAPFASDFAMKSAGAGLAGLHGEARVELFPFEVRLG